MFKKVTVKKENTEKLSTNPSYSFSESLRFLEYLSKVSPKGPLHHIGLFISKKWAMAPK